VAVAEPTLTEREALTLVEVMAVTVLLTSVQLSAVEAVAQVVVKMVDNHLETIVQAVLAALAVEAVEAVPILETQLQVLMVLVAVEAVAVGKTLTAHQQEAAEVMVE
jgi:chromate transport protein ChrA